MKLKCYIFCSKLPDPARGTNSEYLGDVFVFMWAYKIKCTCFENNLSLSAKSQRKVTLLRRLATGETSAILCRSYDNCLDVAIYTLEPSNQALKLVCFKDL